MVVDYLDALRAWREDPTQPDALAELVAACRRTGATLPPEADPAVLIPGLADRALAANRAASGQEVWVACSRLESATPGEDALCAAVQRMAEPQDVGEPKLLVGCEGGGSTWRRPLPLRFEWDPDDPSPEASAAFASLEAQTDDVLSRLPGVRCKGVSFLFTNEWVRGHDAVLFELPEHGESYLVVVQWVYS